MIGHYLFQLPCFSPLVAERMVLRGSSEYVCVFVTRVVVSLSRW